MKLIDAIRADDADAVRKALQRTRNINKGLEGGYKPLDIAAAEGKVNAIPVLLEAGADPHDKNQPVFSALGRAADGKQLHAVQLLLKLIPFSPEELAEAATAAARQRQVPILEVLRAAGAALDGAMQWAVRDGHTEVVRWCLAQGVDPNLRVKDASDDGGLPLLHAAVYGASATVVAPLVEAGADVDARDGRGRTPLMIAAAEMPRVMSDKRRWRAQLPAAEREGRVIWAAALGDEADFTVADALLDAGADATLTDADGSDALRILISEHGNWLNDDDAPPDPHDEFAEHDRLYRGWVRDLERKLRAAGATGGNPASAALFDAIRRKDAEAVKTLLAHGADVAAHNPADRDGSTALAAAAAKGDPRIVRLLLDAGADANDGSRGTRPIVQAANRGHLEVLQLLVEAGADVNLPEPRSHGGDAPPWNALFVAKMRGNPEVVQYLLSVGAKLPDAPLLPFEPGVEFPNTFTEALVRAPVGPAAEALATIINGRAHSDAWGKSFVASSHGYSLLRLDGSEWTSVLGLNGAGRVVDDRWKDLCRQLSQRCAAPVVLLCHEDTSGHSGYSVYDAGDLVEDFTQGDESLYEEMAGLAEELGEDVPKSLGTGAFFSKRGRTLTAEQIQNGYTVLQDLAAAEGFRTLNYGPGAPPGQRFEFDLLGLRRKVAEAAYVTA